MADPNSAMTLFCSEVGGVESRRKPTVTRLLPLLLQQRTTPSPNQPSLLHPLLPPQNQELLQLLGKLCCIVLCVHKQRDLKSSHTLCEQSSLIIGGLHFSVQPTHACEEGGEGPAHKECEERGVMSLFY